MAMRDQSWSNLVAVVAAVVAILAVTSLAVVAPMATPPSVGSIPPNAPFGYYNLSIVRGPSGDFVYSQTQLSVPSDVVVIFTITNYDPTSSLLPTPSDAAVAGTQNGTMTVQSPGGVAVVNSVPTNDVSHTFTMSDAYYRLNVPIPPAYSAGQPTQVSFAVDFHFPGTFDWGCVAYCGGPLMVGMYGTITVG